MNESLDSRQLRAFVVLAKTGSYAEAAKQLYVTHSAISHSMRSLEEQVGCRLFNKLGKKSVLTEAGEALLHHAVRVLEEMKQARRTLTELNRWGARRLRIAADPLFVADVMAPVLAKLHREFPHVRLQLISSRTEEPAQLLENNRADLVLTAKPSANEGIEFLPVLADRFELVVRAGHPLTAKPAFTADELSRQVCILAGQYHGERPAPEEFLQRRGFQFNLTMEMDSVEAIKGFLRETQAVSFLPAWKVTTELRSGVLAVLPMGRKHYDQVWGISHRRARPLNHVEATLLKLCLKRVGELS